jgi:hypothetical protein
MPPPQQRLTMTEETSLVSQAASMIFQSGDTSMGDKGSKDKDKKEQQKKAKLTLKEKRKVKKEKQNK